VRYSFQAARDSSSKRHAEVELATGVGGSPGAQVFPNFLPKFFQKQGLFLQAFPNISLSVLSVFNGLRGGNFFRE
jgi:hypothetical protein